MQASNQITFVNTRVKDLTGSRFGKLVVRERAPNKVTQSKTYSAWFCLCDCGQVVCLPSYRLTAKNFTKSCGCWHREATTRMRKHATDDDAMFAYCLRSTKHGAKIRNLAWELSNEEARSLMFSPCYYCGSVGDQHKVDRRRGVANGIDRVNNQLGYVKTNVVSCCRQCNKAKGTLTQSEFVDWALRLAAHQRSK